MDADKEKVEIFRFMALMHFLSKIGIPYSIINKPGRLTDAEFLLINRHSTWSLSIIELLL